ncbi:MAG: RNA polymerase sigma factor [Gammaproteobacteria bacterium]|nr:RNA polymerase sigma factor [Gammaproteobacteria bacterium]
MLPVMLQTGDDRDLMLRYRDGDAGAFETLYSRHKGALYRYLLRQCNHAANAEEIFQEVWIRVIRSRERYEARAKFTTWLFQIARNCFIDHVRKQGRSAVDLSAAAEPDELHAATGNPESATALSQAGARLAAAIAQLPGEQREAFLLRTEGDFDLAEIAEITGVGRETVKSRLRYAMRKLRNALEEPGHE